MILPTHLDFHGGDRMGAGQPSSQMLPTKFSHPLRLPQRGQGVGQAGKQPNAEAAGRSAAALQYVLLQYIFYTLSIHFLQFLNIYFTLTIYFTLSNMRCNA